VSSSTEKKVLIITYYWPPSGGAGVQRWLKLSKYLPEFGIEPIILTVDENFASYPLLDETLLQDVSPDLKVFKTKSFEVLDWYKKIKKTKKVPYGGFASSSQDIGFVEKAMRFIRGNFFIPDARIGWNKYALKEALRLISTEGIETIITTGTPHSTHLIGLKIKQKYPGVHWFADFRDPWTDIFYNDLLMQTALARKLNGQKEKAVLEQADYVLTVGENLKEMLLKKSAKISDEKFIILKNGFDPADFKSLPSKAPSDNFKIVYLGTASIDYPFQSVLEAIDLLETEEKSKIQLEIIGSFDFETGQLFEKYGNSFSITKKSYIPHDEVPAQLNSADLLILMIPKTKNDKSITTGKIFEYLAIKKLILGIGPLDGDAAKIIKQTDSGQFFTADDVDSIKEFIRSNLKGSNATFIGVDQFSRKNQAEVLAKRILE
jgi:glycosyltransferase involved in cell wall biosynthesis